MASGGRETAQPSWALERHRSTLAWWAHEAAEDPHTSRPWRIHEMTGDFRLEDVWVLRTPGGREDFRRLVTLIVAGDPSRSASGAARALWAIRWTLGRLFGWDDTAAGLGGSRQ